MQRLIPILLFAATAAHAAPFDPSAGEAAWNRTYEVKGEARACADCHTADLTVAGKHRRTGKPIAPLAPSVNPERLTDAKKIEKWFLRNCKWTLGRECTAQEKGDYLAFIRSR